MQPAARRDFLFLLLAGVLITCALLGELTGGKLIQLGGLVASVGVIPWPVVFLTTDLVNEYFGLQGVRRLSLVTVGLILFAFCVVFAQMLVPASPVSPVGDDAFRAVYGQSLWIIAGSVTAFAVGQLADAVIFWALRRRTRGKMLWLRATGSTAVSQLIDSFIVTGIAFWLPGKLTTPDFINLSLTSYSYKLLIAVGLTPLIYLAHSAIDRFLAGGAPNPAGDAAAP